MKNYLVAPTDFSGSEEIERFVYDCEKDFERRLTTTVNELISDPELRVLTISGPTCSGKTTAAKKLVSSLESNGKKVAVISIDDFYYDNDVLRRMSQDKGHKNIDYDSADTIDLEMLNRFEDKLFSDGEAECPVFDFVRGRRTGYRKIPTEEDSVFIFEGIQAIYPEVIEILSAHRFRSMYICPESGILLGDERFSENDIRFYRRIVRDSRFRNTSAEETFKLWNGVRANEDANIFPYVDRCEFRLDSSFAYEISILKPYLRMQLVELSKSSEYKREADNILKRIACAPEISSELLRKESLYKEFI